jgi:hypothetical protein
MKLNPIKRKTNRYFFTQSFVIISSGGNIYFPALAFKLKSSEICNLEIDNYNPTANSPKSIPIFIGVQNIFIDRNNYRICSVSKYFVIA